MFSGRSSPSRQAGPETPHHVIVGNPFEKNEIAASGLPWQRDSRSSGKDELTSALSVRGSFRGTIDRHERRFLTGEVGQARRGLGE